MILENTLKIDSIPGEIGGILLANFICNDPVYGRITVKRGFETDFASVPGLVILPGLVPRSGKGIREASVVHDWIYRGNEGDRFTRAEADKIFLKVMECLGVAWLRRYAAYYGVRMGGFASWKGA